MWSDQLSGPLDSLRRCGPVVMLPLMYVGVHSKVGQPFSVLAIAASAGGITALKRVLATLPKEFPVPVLVVQHLPSAKVFPSKLAEILARVTSLRVKWAEQGELLKSGTVYLAPQDHQMCITAFHSVRLSLEPKVNWSRPAADPLFFSLAEHYAERAVCLVLTGANRDGAKGARAISEAGGRVLAQDEESSEAFEMPLATMRSGRVDFVLPLERIACAVIVLCMVPGGAGWFRVADNALAQNDLPIYTSL